MSIELSPLTADEVALVTMADEAARGKLAEAEARHKAAYLADMRTIQEEFESRVSHIIAARSPGEADAVRLTHDDNGVLCVEIVRRTPRLPSAAHIAALADAVRDAEAA